MKKKELQKDVEAKLHSTFGHLAKDAEKKFSKIVKKVSRLLSDVLHKKETKAKLVKPISATKATTASSVKKPLTKKKASVKIVKKVAAKKK